MTEELEYNRSLEERIDGWMDGITVRVKEMEEKCQEMMDALPELPENFEGLSQDEEENVPEEECRRFSLLNRKGLDAGEGLPYVNLRNRDRFNGFSCDDGYYLKGEPQRLRFRKAWCLLWKLLKENLLDWWD